VIGDSILDVHNNMDYEIDIRDAAGTYATNIDYWYYVQAQGD